MQVIVQATHGHDLVTPLRNTLNRLANDHCADHLPLALRLHAFFVISLSPNPHQTHASLLSSFRNTRIRALLHSICLHSKSFSLAYKQETSRMWRSEITDGHRLRDPLSPRLVTINQEGLRDLYQDASHLLQTREEFCGGSLHQLPRDVLGLVRAYLRKKDLLTFRLLCKQAYTVGDDNSAWRVLFTGTWPTHSQSRVFNVQSLDYKSWYRARVLAKQQCNVFASSKGKVFSINPKHDFCKECDCAIALSVRFKRRTQQRDAVLCSSGECKKRRRKIKT
jgi:hypothetical protein